MKHSPATALLATLVTAALFGCQPQQAAPTSAQIEAAGMKAQQEASAGAERKLMAWAQQTHPQQPVAQRELGLLYQRRPAERGAAMRLFEQAARAGDAEAAYQLGEMLRSGATGAQGTANVTAQPAAAAPWYALAAQRRRAKAALALALLYKNGNGVARDDRLAAHWLTVASDADNPHAMFLLSYIYAEGRGVTADAAKARTLLEAAAEHEYPPALQELAMTVQLGDAHSPRDESRADHLLKEANEHRRNNWNRF